MSYGTERERWFAFRSERLRIFMEAWLNAHALRAVPRPPPPPEPVVEEAPISSVDPKELAPASESREGRKVRSAEALRKSLRELVDVLGPRDLDTLLSFAEFLKTRRAVRSFAHHAEVGHELSDSETEPGSKPSTSSASTEPLV